MKGSYFTVWALHPFLTPAPVTSPAGFGSKNNGVHAKVDAGKTKTLASLELRRLPGSGGW